MANLVPQRAIDSSPEVLAVDSGSSFASSSLSYSDPRGEQTSRITARWRATIAMNASDSVAFTLPGFSGDSVARGELKLNASWPSGAADCVLGEWALDDPSGATLSFTLSDGCSWAAGDAVEVEVYQSNGIRLPSISCCCECCDCGLMIRASTSAGRGNLIPPQPVQTSDSVTGLRGHSTPLAARQCSSD